MLNKLRLCVVIFSLCATITRVQAASAPVTVFPDTVPTITSISPPTVYVDSATFTLTVTGTGFVSGAVVYLGYNEVALTTTFVSATKLTAQVPASFLTSVYTYEVFVANPGNVDSNSVTLNVLALDPSINSLSPAWAVAGTNPGAISVNGSNFMSTATILWNGTPVATTYVNSNELEFTPTKAQLGAARIALLAVANPAPGGTSSTLDFDVTYPARIAVLDLPANDIVWDPYAQRIYASLPSSFGSKGNTIAVVNPYNGKVLNYYFAGSEPNQLALSGDSSYLYVGINGNGSVQRLILPKFTHDIDVSLGSNQYGGSNLALSLQVSPSDSHTFAVAEGTSGCCGTTTGVYFFQDSTQLPNAVTYPSINDIVFGNATTLYGYDQGTLSEIAVSSSGGTLSQQWNGLVEGSTIAYAGGLIYGSGGEVLNPGTGLLVGTYDLGNNCCNNGNVQLLPDPAVDRVFAVGNTPFFTPFGVTTYDLEKFTPIAVADLSQLAGSADAQTFVRWGNNGLAFVLTPGCCGYGPSQLILVQSPAMFSTTSKNAVPNAQSLSPSNATHGSGNLLVTLKGTNFVSNSQVTWNGTSLFADYVSPTQLNLYVPAAALASAGTANVVVTNPAPGGGTSSPLSFTVN
jgi:trimeric autotransporter adhesin